ncbi:uncharacterized protein LOC126795630 [Argentina anserina]|uniref:uncharacterized protein LOC126795630 n=1 Tax=Argentina anserina TaxID=57926 RepID=UPI0021765F54|nr:uncharacterized protein LOC126795630 [Potentilla anserina]
MDMRLNEEIPEEVDDDSTREEKQIYKDWHRANRMAKNVMRNTLSDTVISCIDELEYAIDCMEKISQKFKESNKAKAARQSKKFYELKFNGVGSVRNHIMQLIDINNQLKELDRGVNNAQVVHIALESLPSDLSNLKSNYNAQKEK